MKRIKEIIIERTGIQLDDAYIIYASKPLGEETNDL
jgi:hypothetical protein